MTFGYSVIGLNVLEVILVLWWPLRAGSTVQYNLALPTDANKFLSNLTVLAFCSRETLVIYLAH